MGCISSKVIARTLSLHEERNKGTQRNKSNNGFPLLQDIIKSAQSSSDQYFDLVLHSRSFGSNAPSKLTTNDETDSSETTVKLEMSTSVEEDNQQEKDKIVSDDQIEGYESFHLILPDHVLSSLVQENSSGVENKCELANARLTSKAERSDEFLDPKIIKENMYYLNSKGDVGSRSFHTVEEYDDLVRKLMLSESLWFTDKDDIYSSGTTIDQIEDGDSAIKDIMEAKTIAPSEKHDVSIEKGYKRKAIARRLESLKIPSLGNIYAPGTYVTPKFGCYSSSFMGADSENNSCIFPELVSELEQSMQILEEEEENILKQMESNSEESDGKIMDPQERDIIVAGDRMTPFLSSSTSTKHGEKKI